MARKIIVIDVQKQPSGDFEVTAAFWLTAPANRVITKPSTFTSAVVSATDPEKAALLAGTIVEQVVRSGAVPSGTSVGATETGLVAAYNAAQTALTATAAGAQFIGLAWDGTVWG